MGILKKKYYFDKSDGILSVLSFLFLILPLALIVIGVFTAAFFGGIAVLIFEDLDIALRMLVVLFAVMALPMIAGAVWFVICWGKYVCLCLHSVMIDDEGITSGFFSISRRHWSWDEIVECNIGWELYWHIKNNEPLPEGKERFAVDWRKWKYINCKKYIYFSTENLSESERLEIFYGQQKKEYLIAVKYSSELSEYLHKTDRYIRKEREGSGFSVERERLKDRYFGMKDKVKFKQFADCRMGVLYLSTCLGFVYWAILFAVSYCSSLNQSGSSIEILDWIILIPMATVMPLIFAVVSGWNMYWYLRVITVDHESVEVKFLFWRKQRWSWEEINECGVIRDNCEYYKGRIRDQRYIFFSRIPHYLKKDKRFLQQFKRKDVIYVLYSERLYCYLNALGVMGE